MPAEGPEIDLCPGPKRPGPATSFLINAKNFGDASYDPKNVKLTHPKNRYYVEPEPSLRAVLWLYVIARREATVRKGPTLARNDYSQQIASGGADKRMSLVARI